MLNVYPVFVSKFDFDCESNIRLLIEERITTLSKMFLLFSSSFLSRIQQKKVEGQTFLGLACTLLDLACTLLLEKLYLDAKPSCVYGRKISLRLVQLNLVSLGTKGNYKEGMEIVDRKRPNCGNVSLSIDAHFIVVAITALYVTEI